jgi:aromatic-amino-acid transaminase
MSDYPQKTNPLMSQTATATALFSDLEEAPPDPILGVTEAYLADTRPGKVNLGVGVYLGEDGKIPLLESVRQAEAARLQNPTPRGYLPIDGLAPYGKDVQRLLFGEEALSRLQGRVVTAQALGGTGALKLGADLLKRIAPDTQVLISDPSWENHRALFEAAGFRVGTYPYFDAATKGLDFAGMRAGLRAAAPGTIVVLHACCHNPTGVDPTPEQWKEIVAIVQEHGLVPFLDLAYQGFADGIAADAAVVRALAESGAQLLIASSFSKSFSLYGERIGALTLITGGKDDTRKALSQLKRVIRTNYSNPPTHGGALVAAVLGDAGLRTKWESELDAMRDRIKAMRAALVAGLSRHLPGTDFSFVQRQRGMFSYSGLSAAQIERLRKDFAIYALTSGRICVAALNRKNVDTVAEAIAAVVKH